MKKDLKSTSVPTITRTYIALGDESLSGELKRYVEGLKDNTYYTAIAPQIADYEIMVASYQSLQAKASASRDKETIIQKNDARTAVILATISISNAVEEIADGNLLALASTNLPIKKVKKPVIPEGPQEVRVTNSKISGQMDIVLKRPKSNFVIVTKYTMAPMSEKPVWITVYSTVTKFSITGLDTAEEYYVQVGIMAKGNITLWGDITLSPLIS